MRRLWHSAVLSAVGVIAITGVLTQLGTTAASAASSKQPILVGFLGGNEGLGIANVDTVAKAAADYENSIGGIHGRPIKLIVCDDVGTPESVSACADEFVADHVSVVGSRLTTNESSLLTPLSAVNIPFVDNAPTGPAFFSPDAIGQQAAVLFGLTVAAAYGVKHNELSDSLFLVNTASSAGVIGLVKPFFAQAGVAFSDQLVDVGVADLTGPVESELGSNPATITIAGAVTLCEGVMKAAQTLGFKGQFFLSGCPSPQLVSAVGKLVNGAIVAEFIPAGLSKSDNATYTAAMKKYAKGVSPGAPDTDTIFSDVAFIAAGLRTMPASSSYAGADVLAAFHALKNFKYFMDYGIPATCNGTEIKFAPSVCESQSPIIEYKNEKPVFIGLENFHDLLNLPPP